MFHTFDTVKPTSNIMFHTFAAVEPTWNNADDGKPRLPNVLEHIVYEYYTLDELMNEIQVSKASPDLVQAFKNRVGSGVRVPQDMSTLQEATKWLKRFGGKTITFIKDADEHNESVTEVKIPRKIVVGKGKHQIDGRYLEVTSAMNIVGDPEVPKSEIVVVGGIWFQKGIPGNCHLQHLTVRRAKGDGVCGKSSFTMEDVLVEQCRWAGVQAFGTGVVGQCTNMEVSQCGMSGVVAVNGASITLIGDKTTVHHNCTKEYSNQYGLQVTDSSSSLQLISPLTKETVSRDNRDNRYNWGAANGGDINQIKTITKAEFTAARSEGKLDQKN